MSLLWRLKLVHIVSPYIQESSKWKIIFLTNIPNIGGLLDEDAWIKKPFEKYFQFDTLTLTEVWHSKLLHHQALGDGCMLELAESLTLSNE
jgi:hypothetical protein